MNRTSSTFLHRPPIWQQPRVMAIGAIVGVAMIALNLATLFFGDHLIWLIATTVLVDMLAVGTGIFLALREAVLADAQTVRAEEETAQAHAAADDMEAQLAAIVDSAMDAIITLDAEQRIVLFNRAAEMVFRCSRDEALGASIERFLPPQHRAEHRGRIEAFGQTGATARRMGDGDHVGRLRFVLGGTVGRAARAVRLPAGGRLSGR